SCVGAANHLVPRSVQFLTLRDILSLSDIYFSWPPAEHHSSNLNATEQCSNSGGTWVRHRPPCAQVSTPGGGALPGASGASPSYASKSLAPRSPCSPKRGSPRPPATTSPRPSACPLAPCGATSPPSRAACALC